MMTFKKQNKRKKYSSTKIKARNILPNPSYLRFKPQDFDKDAFIIDILTSVIQNLNPVGLDRKLETELENN